MNLTNLCILLFAFCTFNLVHAQYSISGTETINWLQNNLTETNYHISRGENKIQDPEIPFYTFKVKVPFWGTGKVSIKSIANEKINISKKDNSFVKDDYYASIMVSEYKTEYEALITIFPVRKRSGEFEKMLQFEYTIGVEPSLKATNRGPEPTYESVLSSGDVYKIEIGESGVYKIDKNIFEKLGVNINNIIPSKVKVYSRSGGILPEIIADQKEDDLVEIPMTFSGSSSDKFNSTDFFTVYLEGADEFVFNKSLNDFVYEKNIYAEKNYAYLKFDGENGKRVNVFTISQPISYSTSNYDDYQAYEEDRYNLLALAGSAEGSGKLWFGDLYGNNDEKSYGSKFDFTNIDFGLPSEISINFAGRSESSGSLKLSLGNVSLTKNISSVAVTQIETNYASYVNLKGIIALTSTPSDLKLNYSGNNSSAQGWLDNITLKLKKNINFNSRMLTIRSNEFANHEVCEIKGIFNDATIWDVSDLSEITAYLPQSNSLVFKGGVSAKKLIAFNNSSLKVPNAVGKIGNQNLHSISRTDMIVLYPAIFKEAAQKFIDHRSQTNGLIVTGVQVDQIYQEFSSGRQDPSAIRDFARMVSKRDNQFRYMLLVGDGSYDQRQLTQGLPDTRFIPVYETDASLHPIWAFPTDDFYALLSDNEGSDLRGALDISVGRLPVKTEQEAMDVVNKIIDYDTSPDRFGPWRLKVGYTADDEDSNTHYNQCDEIARKSFAQFPNINQQKVYIDAYNQEITPGGARYPDVTTALNNNIENGQLVLSYLGHGGPTGWSQERILKTSDIVGWKNKDKYPVIITATCSFSGYDDPSIVSAGEHGILNKDGGAIALFTTVRAVFSSDNKRLTENVFDNLFLKENGKPLALGDIIIRAKNEKQDTSGENSRKFTLLGDPSQVLAYPEHNVVVTSINGKDPFTFTDTIKSLEKVVVEGEIHNDKGETLSSFNGVIYPVIYDKASTLQTLANDASSYVSKFSVYKNIIYKGTASVIDGKYKFEFVVPTDINYEVGNARMSLYATDNFTDAAGSFTGFKVGGSSINGITDDTKPTIEAFMNDEKFVYGGITNENPTILLKVSDDSGINVTGTSIGHDLTAVITGPQEEKYVLNEYFESELNDYKKGSARLQLKSLKSGNYTLTAKVWDIANNSAETKIEFRVADQKDAELKNVFNYPNPFTTQTNFTFEHDLAGADVRTVVYIYTLTGKIIKTIEKEGFETGFRSSEVSWDGRDDFGQKLGKGVYYYKIKMHSPSLGLSRESKFSKLVLL